MSADASMKAEGAGGNPLLPKAAPKAKGGLNADATEALSSESQFSGLLRGLRQEPSEKKEAAEEFLGSGRGRPDATRTEGRDRGRHVGEEGDHGDSEDGAQTAAALMPVTWRGAWAHAGVHPHAHAHRTEPLVLEAGARHFARNTQAQEEAREVTEVGASDEGARRNPSSGIGRGR